MHRGIYCVLFFFIHLAASAPWSAEEDDYSFEEWTLAEQLNITFHLFNYPANSSVVVDTRNLEGIDFSLPFVFYVHGFQATFESSKASLFSNAYGKKGDYNFIAVDYSPLAYGSYLYAVEETPTIGYAIAEFVNTLYSNYSVNPEDVHVIGHSLGAHVAGHVGRGFQNITGGVKIGRVTGLDAVLIGFIGNENKMRASDATVVFVLHTSCGHAGLILQAGTVDFYPNGDTVFTQQPGCEDVSCSHARSEEFFLESLENSEAFRATKCDSYWNYNLGLCDENSSITMGGNLAIADQGKYFLDTNAEYPYSQS